MPPLAESPKIGHAASINYFAEGFRMDEIAELVQMEAQNYEVSREHLGDAGDLVQDLVELYRTIGDMIAESAVKPRDEIVAGGMFLYSCRYQLVLAALNVMRGHLNDSHFFTRKAIELARSQTE
jgi:hypothetical protein